MTTLTTDDLRDALYEAQEHLFEAIRLIETYVSATDDSNAEAYLLDHLRIFAGREHGFLSRDLNLDDLIERLDERDEEDDEDEAEEEDGNAVFYTPVNRHIAASLSDDAADDDLPEVKTVNGHVLYLLRNNLGPIRNSFGEPIYATIPTD